MLRIGLENLALPAGDAVSQTLRAAWSSMLDAREPERVEPTETHSSSTTIDLP